MKLAWSLSRNAAAARRLQSQHLVESLSGDQFIDWKIGDLAQRPGCFCRQPKKDSGH